MTRRTSGILLHLNSLPSRYGTGDLGPAAYQFADFLHSAGQSHWQTLPVSPPAVDIPHCPYSAISAFAGDPLLISPELLLQAGYLRHPDLANSPDMEKKYVDYRILIPWKTRLLTLAFQRFKSTGPDEDYEKFCEINKHWLQNFAIFASLRKHFNTGLFYNWPKDFRSPEKIHIDKLDKKTTHEIEKQKFLQYCFFAQWFDLKKYCNKKRISLIGDIPIYVSCDSADVWSNPQFFKLNRLKKPKLVSGVPPDMFCKTGQLWRNPVYDWKALKQDGFSWWIDRVDHNLAMFDMVRLDHFRGLVACWEVPARNKTAARGKWARVPKEDLFLKILKTHPAENFIVEDLGHITGAVKNFIRKKHLTSTRVLQFGFDWNPKTNAHHPRNIPAASAVYTGTHDTNTARGWFEKEASEQQKKNIEILTGQKPVAENIHLQLLDLAMNSRAEIAITPMQDILGLDDSARMNLPGSGDHRYWRWRVEEKQITLTLSHILRKATHKAGRLPAP